MPVYEYRCSLGHHYEKMEGFDAPVEQACPECGGSARRLLSVPAVIFKGPGFYSTDNRKSYGSDDGSGSKKEEGSADSSSGSDGD